VRIATTILMARSPTSDLLLERLLRLSAVLIAFAIVIAFSDGRPLRISPQTDEVGGSQNLQQRNLHTFHSTCTSGRPSDA
jgi:hypothetical protein